MVKKIQQPIVLKLGGAEGLDFQSICEDVASLKFDRKVVVVHGGSAEANALGKALGQPPRFVTSPSGYTSRYTDRPTLEIFAMAINGKLNTLLVEQLQGLGVNALGLSGLDGGLIRARRKPAIRILENGKRKVLHGDYTGKITTVNAELLIRLLEFGVTPVISPMALSEEGEALNVDADRAAAALAAAMGAETLMLFTAAPGLMRTFPDESTVIKRLPAAQLDEALEYAEGRMKKKVLGAQEALRGGVQEVIIADGRVANPIAAALAGRGTLIK
jgi:acetylglutamate/LysW-gamma-L-alpha-aminoadipate kinase